jgi:hypothetical protein
MLQEQLAMGEAVKGFNAADRARSSSGGGSFANIANQDLTAAVAAAAAAMPSQLSALGRRGRSSGGGGGGGASKLPAASRSSSAPVDLGDDTAAAAAGAATSAVSDLFIDLQDAAAPLSIDASKAAVSAEREADAPPNAVAVATQAAADAISHAKAALTA